MFSRNGKSARGFLRMGVHRGGGSEGHGGIYRVQSVGSQDSRYARASAVVTRSPARDDRWAGLSFGLMGDEGLEPPTSRM
jgi:hypothetical protein